MDVDASITPRLRMSRRSPVQYDRSNLASTSEAGPSRLPNFSQILDLDMKDMPLSDDQFSSNEQNTPKFTTTPTPTRSDNPAAVLRALLSRLPAHPPSPTKSIALSAQGSTEQERESDFDTVSESNFAPSSIAQESLKHIFSNAFRDPGNTPQKARRKRNSIDSGEVEGNPRVEKERAKNKGKRRSVSDDEVENTSQSISRRDIRYKSTSQPITMEFLRERFSDSHNLRTTEDDYKDDSSNDTATILRNSSQATPPAATSTPQQSQSLRLSADSSLQFHSNLLDRNSEMRKAIEVMDSYDEDVTHGQNSTTHAFKSSKTSPVLRHHSHHNGSNVISDSSRSKPPKDRSSISHSERHLRSEVHSANSRLSPLPRSEHYRPRSPLSRTNSSAGSLRSHDDDYVDVVHERQRNWNSPRPIWHSLKNDFETSSPPKGLPDLPTPSSSDESANQSYRNIQSGSKWMATPKPPGGWLNTPKPSRVTEHGSPSDDAIQSNGDTPLAADDGLSYLETPTRAEATHGFQPSAKTPKPPGGWSTPVPAPPIPAAQSMPVDSPLDIPERSQGLLTPVASFSKGSKLEPKTPAAPGAWLATPAVKKSILKVRFEPEVSTLTDKSESGKHPDPSFDSNISGVNGLDDGDDSLQRTEELSSKSPPSPRRQKSPKSPKIRVLDAFGREQEPDLSNRERVNSSLRVVNAMGHEIDEESHVEDTEAAATPSHPTVSRGELLSRIRNGLGDLVDSIEDLDKDDQPSSIDHDRVQQLTTISRQARGLRERLYSQADSSHSSLLSTKASWFSANPKFYIFLIILQLSLTWLVYRISINRAQELWMNRYYDPFNPELHLYIFKSDASIHVPRSEGARTTAWSSLVGHIWDGWIYFIGNMHFRFWQAWDKDAVLPYDSTWTPT